VACCGGLATPPLLLWSERSAAILLLWLKLLTVAPELWRSAWLSLLELPPVGPGMVLFLSRFTSLYSTLLINGGAS
jgi:hypothetical protein